MAFKMDPNLLYNTGDDLDKALINYKQHLEELSLMLTKISSSSGWIEDSVKDEFLNTFKKMLEYNYALESSYENFSTAFKRVATSIKNHRSKYN